MDGDYNNWITGSYSPLIVLASVLIFYGFTLLDFKKELKKLPGLTLYIYLVHVGVWDFIVKVFRLIKGKSFITELDGAVWIPVFTVVVFGVSYWLSKLYLYIWGKLDKEKRITNYFTKAEGTNTSHFLF